MMRFPRQRFTNPSVGFAAMSETPVEHRTPIEKHLEDHGSAEAGAPEPRSQSLKAGGEFLKALAADLGAAASRLKPKPRRSQPPSRPASRPGMGRVLWRASMVFLGVLLICSGMLSAAMLWVVFGSPLASRHGAPAAPQLRAEATAPIPPSPPPAAAAEQQNPSEETKAQASIPPGPPPAAAAEQKPGEETQAAIPTGSQPNQPPAMQTATPGAGQAASATPPDQHPGAQCAVDLCAARYRSFNAADCTYEPLGGGPRSLCALGAQPSVAGPQSLPAATDPSPKATETQPAATVQSDQAGAQCNRSLCAATYRSFNAADCTYQPNGGGPRSICELNKGPAEAAQQTVRPATDSTDSAPETGDMPVPVMVQDVGEPAMPDWAGGPQCNRARCAATYRSFHAADCTYQPPSGGPRRVCEP
jgi:hypothetical protein